MSKKRFKTRLFTTAGVALVVLISLFFTMPKFLGDVVYPLPAEYAPIIRDEAIANGIPPSFMAALILAESSFHKDSVSGAGAIGLTQMMPGTARATAQRNGITGAINLKDPNTSIKLGTLHIKELFDKYNNLDEAHQIKAVLIAYNAGSGVSDAWVAGGMNDKYLSRGVLSYANRIMRYEQAYRNAYAKELGMEPINLQAPRVNIPQQKTSTTTFWVDLLTRTVGLKI